jgi:hypothetical protein
MKTGTAALLTLLALGIAAPVLAQDGLRVPGRSGDGIDPSLASGWLSPTHERLGFAPSNWRDAIGFAPAARLQWTYPLGQYSFGMSIASGRDYEAAPIFGTEARQYGLVGRYWFSADWSVNAEAVSRDASSVFRLQDFRIGLRRQF